MTIGSFILFQILQLLLLSLVYIAVESVMKFTARSRTDFWFFYHFIPRHVKRPQCHMSQYFDKFPVKNMQVWNYATTLDDEFLKQLAQELQRKIGNKSDKYKAGYILKMVQSGYMYQSDYKTYGETERYAFPVCTQYIHVGDCEDGALLGAGLSVLMGLDVQIVRVNGHLAYGVNVKGFGYKFVHKEKKYLWCESTSIFPIGMHFNDKRIIATYSPMNPPENYVDQYTYYDAFYRYPLN